MSILADLSTPVAACVQECLQHAPVTLEYQTALAAALQLPGNILSANPDARWASLIWTCCVSTGGHWIQAVPAAAAAEIFMVALDVLDDIEDNEPSLLCSKYGTACTLNISTGLLLLAQQVLLQTPYNTSIAPILLNAGMRAASGQHEDLLGISDQCHAFDAVLAITARKSASLVAALCQIGALCAGANTALQQHYAQFGWYIGMVAQLINDIIAVAPGTIDKTDIVLGRPTLPLISAVRYNSVAYVDVTAVRSMLWSAGPVHLTWTVAETYRRQACALIPLLTDDLANQTSLAALLPTLCWMPEQVVDHDQGTTDNSNGYTEP